MGDLLMMLPFNLRREHSREFGSWLRRNEPTIRKKMPPGATYVGMFASSFGTGRSDAVLMIEFSDYRDLDVWRESNDPEMAKLLGEFYAFTDGGIRDSAILERGPRGFESVRRSSQRR